MAAAIAAVGDVVAVLAVSLARPCSVRHLRGQQLPSPCLSLSVGSTPEREEEEGEACVAGEGGSRSVRLHTGREGEEGEARARALVVVAACCGKSRSLSRRTSKGTREESRR